MSYSLTHPATLKNDPQLKTWHLYIIVLFANLVVLWLFNEFILTREVYYNLLSEQMESTRIDEYFDIIRKVSLWGYIAQPVLLLIQITFLALLIQMPLVLMFVEIRFSYLFRLVILASLLMLAASVIRFLWLYNVEPSEISKNLLNLMPLSINQFLSAAKYPELAYAILGKFNIFEILWCYVIYKGLVSTEKVKAEYAGILVFSIWTLLLLFQWGLGAYFQGANA